MGQTFSEWQASRDQSGVVQTRAGQIANPLVYLGGGEYKGSIFDASVGSHLPVDQANLEIYGWSDEERAQWGKRLYGAGLIDDPNNYKAMVGIWQYAVGETANYNFSGRPTMTPWGFIDILESSGAGKDALEARKKQEQALLPSTSTSTSFNAVPTKADAHAAIKTLFREQLGRDPEDGELDRYTSMMLSKMKADPGKTVNTTITDPKARTSTSTSRSYEGYNPAEDLESGVKDDPEWGAYQAATTYFNALQGAIGAPG